MPPIPESEVPRRSPALVRRYLDQGLWSDETIGEALHRVAQGCPERPAVIDPDRSLTYAELDQLSDRLAAALIGLGGEPREVVIFQVGNAVESIVAYYAVLKAGMIPLCSLPQHGVAEIEAYGAATGARFHMIQADWPRKDLVEFAARIGIENVVSTRGAGGDGTRSIVELIESADPRLAREAVEAVSVRGQDVGVMQLSGGTTATPKMIPRLHADYLCNARAYAEAWGWDETNVVLHALPVIHNAGLALAVHPPHLLGGACVLSSNATPEQIFAMVERERVTDVILNSTVVYRLLESELRGSYDLSSLRRVAVGPQTPQYAQRLEEELGIRALGVFGMGEGLIMRTPWEASDFVRRFTVGRPISTADEVRILNPESEEEVPAGDVGELACRGPYTIPGYFDAADHNAVAFTSDGFYRTGDLAQAHEVDGEAHYSIMGRIKDNVNRGGEKINAEELEQLLGDHPAVAEVAVVGMPDPELGERVCAFLVVRGGSRPPDVTDLAEFLLAKEIAKFKLPERVEIVAELPVTNIGKVAKKELRERIGATLEAEVRENAV